MTDDSAPIAVIERHLASVSCGFRRVSPTALLTGFKTQIPYYEFGCQFEIRADRSWISIRAFPHLGVDPEVAPAVSQFLMEMNAYLYEIRCCMIDGAVIVASEIAASRCSRPLFLERLSAMIRQINSIAAEISSLVNDENLRKCVISLTRLRTLKAMPIGYAQEITDMGFDFNAAPVVARHRDAR